MDRLKHILVITLLLSCQQIIFAQNSSSIGELNEIDKNLNESVFISTNTNSFLTGETLLYKIFCINKTTNAPTKYSKIAYLELVDADKKTVFTHKLFLENGTGNGDFFIPTTLETGTYKIVGYTNWMLNKHVDEYFTSDIYIINPYKEKPSNTNSLKEKTASESITDGNISFDLKNKTFGNRALVDLKINVVSNDFLKGNYAISVRKADEFSAQSKKTFKEYQISNQSSVSNTTINALNFIFPEVRGEIISGKISSSGEIKNKKVALSIIGKNYDLKFANTDEQGRFYFNLEKPNPNNNIVIQLVDENKENYSIEIDKPKKTDFSTLSFSPLELNADSNQNITERLISSQVENAYYNVKKDSLIAPNNFVPFYGSQSKEYIFDDFTRFPTMEETVTEVIVGVVFRKENNNYLIRVFDYDENYESTLPPLVLVDGLIIENLNEFFTYSPKNLYKANVIRGLYYYGSKTFNGILSFTTKKGDYESKLKGSFLIKPELLRPQGKKEYFQPNYSDDKNSRIPDYRHQLLWLPNADLSSASSNIQFYTSDVSGQFEVTLEGFSASGKPVYIKEIINIKDSISN
ncbi:hypothetical protein GKZ90_0008180 [Flavobacterium sp. MC2016-06]|uniref:hypothetical protein n=1 Tax=Flavobacterium sp. MC2016-06 TaxID=2676308 RepID=UPI0012BAD99B|nr:hypothetical protein [Flavobacterium sp. MC2016-06]MBU3857992.1 hypothetical protein [Flavobacterium sp. MC2016-06]